MSSKSTGHSAGEIRFSISAKLIAIISIIVVVSLGSITILVSWLVHNDLRKSAEDNNFEINRRSAMEAESVLENIRSDSRVLIQTVTASPSGSDDAVNFFFTQYPQTASVFFIAAGREERLFVNKQFFASNQINEVLASSWFTNNRDTMARALRGETVIQNAAPHFAYPVLALYFHLPDGGLGAVVFSSRNLSNNLGYGTNQSYMLNADGDLLCFADDTLVRDGINIANHEFIRSILLNSQRSMQQLMETDFGVSGKSSDNTGTNYLLAFWKKTLVFVQNIFNRLGIDKNISGVFENNESRNKPRQFIAYTKLNTAGAVVITSIDYNKVFEGINATTRRNIYLTIAVLSISIIFIWFFSKSISVPLKSLAAAANEIEGGKFDQKLDIVSNDEIGVLSSSFEKMCSALHIFGKFTNREIAVKAMRGEIKPGGLSKHATIFFSDIREFTAKSEGFTKFFGIDASDKIVHWLNQYFTKMVDCVEKTNGVVDKFIGDAVMAHWGTAYTSGNPRNDAFNCVKAALMMRKALYYLNRNRRSNDPSNPSIRIGCGINSGIVTAGQLGSDMRMEYTVIGDPVNLASRIEALTKPLGTDILVSEDTWKLVGDKFITEEMPSVTVKGKAKPVRIFAIVNFMGEEKGPQSLSELRDLLGIEAPKLENVDVNADEKKYKIGESA